ncbi:MAG: response regulator [Candidatus Paceibacterota bacterium]|jgi:DNA-binding response OmpR family regulator
MAKKKKTILIVEDDRYLTKAYSIKIKNAGFNVLLSANGEDGLVMAKEKKPDLIVLDLLLPRVDGFEFLKQIKADDELKGIPVLTISVLGQKSDQERALALGAEAYFIKTEYKLEDIVDRIKEYLK